METTLSSEKITELAKAMICVQQTLSPALKDGKNTFTKSNYATLSSVMAACRAALLKHNIWMTQYPIPAEIGHLGLVTKIVHTESGEWQSSLIVMPLSKNDPQGYGSAITYARRYGLSALVGIITDNDDDGESACQRRDMSNLAFPPHNTWDHGSAAASKSSPQDSSSNHTRNANLPRLDGVDYKTETARDGRQCILATGNTHSKREFLSSAGFRWDGTRKIWWRYADAA
ncbi:MAG: ERF family protein [Desulfobacterium sp.]|nr:ERF family protein [Desulfobacterium sp.]